MKERRKLTPQRRNPNVILDINKSSRIVELEAAVIGAILKEKDALTRVLDILKPDSFLDEKHEAIYQAILQLFGASEVVDILTVSNKLRTLGELEFIGGASYLARISSRVSPINIEEDARKIVQYAIKKNIVNIMSEVQTNAYEDSQNVYDLLDKTEQQIRDIQEGNLSRNIPDINSVVVDTIAELKNKASSKVGESSVPSGFSALDRVTGGWHNTELIIIAARPAMGKTAFVVSALRNAAIEFQIPVALFSLEMSNPQVMLRLISSEAEIESQKLRKGELGDEDWAKIAGSAPKLENAPIYIDDTPGLTILELRSKARKLKAKHGIRLLVVDYLQLMSAGKSKRGLNREQEIAAISRSLKTIAKELNIPVIALSQLSRSVETRGGDKRPQLSDLRESGAIEQDADVVMFLYRPEYYNFTEDEKGNSTKGIAEVIVAKNRSGSLDIVPLHFVSTFTRFAELDGFSLNADQYEQRLLGSNVNQMNGPDPRTP
jgi:replicative DNA helicase